MTVTHTKGAWWEYYAETNYAGGPAGAAYATTAPSGAAELTPCNLPYNEMQTMPQIGYDHEALDAAGLDISTKIAATKGMTTKPGKLVQYMQNGVWLDYALGISPVESGGGALPPSFLLHWDNGNVEYTAYGCYITKYTLTATPKSFIKEELEFDSYDVQAEVVEGDTPWYSTDTILNFKHIGTTTITIDGTAITDVQSVKVTVTNSYHPPDKKQAGSYFHKFPFLLKRDVEIELEFLSYEGDHILDELTEAADPCTIVFTPLGGANFSATNMQVKKGSTNIHEVPEKGLWSYKATFEIGGAAVFTTP